MDGIYGYEGGLAFFQDMFPIGADKNDRSVEDYNKLLAAFGEHTSP